MLSLYIIHVFVEMHIILTMSFYTDITHLMKPSITTTSKKQTSDIIIN